MITCTYSQFQMYDENGVSVCTKTFFGLSTDAKPMAPDVGNGSAFIEMDTGKIYFYNYEGQTWIEWGAESATVNASVQSIDPSRGLRSAAINDQDDPTDAPDVEADTETDTEENPDPEREDAPDDRR